MSSKDKKQTNSIPSICNPDVIHIGIAVSEWYPEICNSLLDKAVETLHKSGVLKSQIHIFYVPGTFELPVAAKMLLQKYTADAVICIGCVIKGETKHDEYISNAVSQGLINLSIMSGKPIVFGVLTPNTKAQAEARSGGHLGNKGEEAALSAIKMINLKADLKGTSQSIGF